MSQEQSFIANVRELVAQYKANPTLADDIKQILSNNDSFNTDVTDILTPVLNDLEKDLSDTIKNTKDTLDTKIITNADSISLLNTRVGNNETELSKEATVTDLGRVKLSDGVKKYGTDNSVITAETFFAKLENIVNELDKATNKDFGVVRLANEQDIMEKESGAVLTVNNLKSMYLPLDFRAIYSKGYDYFLEKIGDNLYHLNHFGFISTICDSCPLTEKLIFPFEIPDGTNFSINVTPIIQTGQKHVSAYVYDKTKDDIMVAFLDKDGNVVEGQGYFNVSAVLNMNTESLVLYNLKGGSAGSSVALLWEAKYEFR